ncbi:MAG: DUF4834 family protein [Tannerella sp.]|jgi:hypothetical protein|nr:DUF4834 family protein [Tannerella sp.]
MIKFLAIIFFFFLILVSLLGFSVLRSFKSIFFGRSKNSREQSRTSSTSGRQRTQTNSRSRGKIIPREEGEYIDYEEVKD